MGEGWLGGRTLGPSVPTWADVGQPGVDAIYRVPTGGWGLGGYRPNRPDKPNRANNLGAGGLIGWMGSVGVDGEVGGGLDAGGYGLEFFGFDALEALFGGLAVDGVDHD